MNYATRFTKLALLLIVAGALALAGCGGDDGVSQSVHDQLQQDRDAEEAARLAAEEAARQAEADRLAAEEAARLAAEEAARQAEADRLAAEEAARLAAEEAARQAEADRLGRIQAAMDAIAMADTPAAAQAAYDMVKDEATLTEGVALQAAVDMRVAELATMDMAAQQRMAMSTAAGNIDVSDLSTQANVDAAKMAIYALEAAIAAAADVSDADKAMYQATVTASKNAVMTAQGALDHASQTSALMAAVMDLNAIDLGNLTTQAAIDAAQAAIDALQAALDAATELSDAEKATAMTELATASRTVMMAQGRVDIADQMMVLSNAVDALGMIDLDNLMTQAQIDAADAAIIALDLALAAATDLTAAQKLDATVDVTLAKRKVADAKVVLANNIDGQRTALMTAANALGMIDLTDLSDQAKIDAAGAAVKALKMALGNATHLSDADKSMYMSQYDTAKETVRTAQTGMDSDGRMAAQRTALSTTMMAAQTAVGMVNDTATDAQVMAADDAIDALQAAIDGAVDLPAGDTDVAMAQGTLNTLKGLLASAKSSRMTAMAEAEKTRNEMMAATAAKLHAGISPPMGAVDGTGDDVRFAGYNDAGTPLAAKPTLSSW